MSDQQPSERWRSRTFGVELELSFPVPSLLPLNKPSAPVACRLRLGTSIEIEAGWPREESELRGVLTDELGAFEFHEHPRAGYLLGSGPCGRYRISADGAQVICVPPELDDWYWQRLLIGQVLPLVAALQGLEVLHASAVSLEGLAYAFSGEPGAGKSTLATNLALRGATMLADDVLALRSEQDRLIAEPGAALINLVAEQAARLDQRTLHALGAVLGSSDKLHLRATRLADSLPLGALYLLQPSVTATTTIDRLEHPDPRDLLACSFVPYVSYAERVLTQLDIAALLGRSIPVFRVRVDRSAGAEELAAQVYRHASSGEESSAQQGASQL